MSIMRQTMHAAQTCCTCKTLQLFKAANLTSAHTLFSLLQGLIACSESERSSRSLFYSVCTCSQMGDNKQRVWFRAGFLLLCNSLIGADLFRGKMLICKQFKYVKGPNYSSASVTVQVCVRVCSIWIRMVLISDWNLDSLWPPCGNSLWVCS